MSLDPNQALLFFVPLLPACLFVIWSDLATMKIPNKVVLGILAIYVVVGPFVLPLEDYAWRFTHFAVMLIAGMAFTAARVMGAGDAKFLAAAAPFIALNDAILVGAILAPTIIVTFILHRIARATPLRTATASWESWDRPREFPMGVPLALTVLLYLGLRALGQV
jgi:prepilin peptidase CpaA